MLNYLPIIGQAVQLVAELLFSGFSDLLGQRLPFLLLHAVRSEYHSSSLNLELLTYKQVISILSLSILVVRPENRHLHMTGYYLNYVGE